MKIRKIAIIILVVAGTAILLVSQLKYMISQTNKNMLQTIQQELHNVIDIKNNLATSSAAVRGSSSSVSPSSSSSSRQQQQRVFLLPKDYKNRDETKHIFLDGIQKSNKLELTTNMNDKSSHWFVDVLRCDIEELEQNLEKSGRKKIISTTETKDEDSNNNATTSSNNTTNATKIITTAFRNNNNNNNNNNNSDNKNAASKIFLVDYSDYGFDDDDLINFFDLSSSFFGMGNVYYATRQHVDDRKIIIKEGIQYENETFHNMGVVWNTTANYLDVFKNHGLGGRIKAVRYCVRSDMIVKIQSILTAQNESYSNLIYRSRPKDVASFWNASQDVEPSTGARSSLRAAVCRMLLRLQQQERSRINNNMTYNNSNSNNNNNNNTITVTAKLVGENGHEGRNIVADEYSKALIDHKIIVVAQRDQWEGHYRLMEAFAGGALVMTDPMHPLPYMLKDGNGIVVYYSLQDLKEKVLYYIHNTDERIKIASHGYNIVMNYHRSWHVMERIILGNWSIDSLH